MSLTVALRPSSGQPDHRMELPRGYVCYRATHAPKIDGKLDDAAWRAASWTDDFVDIERSEIHRIEGARADTRDAKPKPRFRTRAKMLWDDTHFYIGAELAEPHVWGTFTEHDSPIFRENNNFEWFIDPDGDNHQYYEFEINALNTGWDLRLVKPYRDGGPALNEWEIPGLKTAVHVNGTLNDPRDTDRGWSVEMAIPWPALAEFANRPTPPKDGDQWRVNFSRVEWRHEIVSGKYRKVTGTREDNWVWSPQGAINMHMPERWGYVQFSTARPGRARFARDVAEPARDLLIRLYHAQREFRQHEKRYASSLVELQFDEPRHASVIAFELNPTADGYEASADVKLSGGKVQRWRVRQDSRLWMDGR